MKQLILISNTGKPHGRDQYCLSEKGKKNGSKTMHLTKAEAKRIRLQIKEENNAEQPTDESQ
jgi:hypothetical protein